MVYGFGVYFPIVTIRNPQNPILFIEAPISGAVVLQVSSGGAT